VGYTLRWHSRRKVLLRCVGVKWASLGWRIGVGGLEWWRNANLVQSALAERTDRRTGEPVGLARRRGAV